MSALRDRISGMKRSLKGLRQDLKDADAREAQHIMAGITRLEAIIKDEESLARRAREPGNGGMSEEMREACDPVEEVEEVEK